MTHDRLDDVLDACKTHRHAPDLRGAITGSDWQPLLDDLSGKLPQWPEGSGIHGVGGPSRRAAPDFDPQGENP